MEETYDGYSSEATDADVQVAVGDVNDSKPQPPVAVGDDDFFDEDEDEVEVVRVGAPWRKSQRGQNALSDSGAEQKHHLTLEAGESMSICFNYSKTYILYQSLL